MEKQNPLSELMRTTMEHIKTMADANTIIGTPIHAEGVTLIPVSKLSFGVGGFSFLGFLGSFLFFGSLGFFSLDPFFLGFMGRILIRSFPTRTHRKNPSALNSA